MLAPYAKYRTASLLALLLLAKVPVHVLLQYRGHGGFMHVQRSPIDYKELWINSVVLSSRKTLAQKLIQRRKPRRTWSYLLSFVACPTTKHTRSIRRASQTLN